MNGWISCSERMPADGDAVLVWVPSRAEIAGSYFEAGGVWIGESGHRFEQPPTHWMPLPAPPGGGSRQRCPTCNLPMPLMPGTAHWSGCPESPLYDLRLT